MRTSLILLTLAAFVPCVAPASFGAQDDEAYDKDAAAIYLLRKREVTFAEGGLKTVKIHNRLKVLKREALDYAADVSIEYNNFRETIKLVQAHTTTADGRKLDVQKDAVHDSMPPHVASYKMYSDARTLRFSLPAVEVDAVLDYEVEITHHKPVMEGHAWDTEVLDNYFYPIKEAEYVVKYPQEMKLTVTELNCEDPAVDAEKTPGMMRWTRKEVPKLKYEPDMPPFSEVRGTVHVTTVPSWEAIQAWYADLKKDRDVTTPEISKTVKEVTSGLEKEDERIRALFMYMQKDVRYVGIELGRSAYQPHAAAECLRNLYGDCKDQSILLSVMLREVGVKAYPALVRTNTEGALVSKAPHPNQFNHVVVYLPREGGDLWLDPTVKYIDEQSHPYELDGVSALVVGCEGVLFKEIEAPDPARSLSRTIYDVDMRFDGFCRVKEIYEYVGREGSSERVRHENIDKEERRRNLTKAIAGMAGRTRLLSFDNSDPYDLSIPFRNWVEYETDTFMTPGLMGFSVTIGADSVADTLRIEEPVSLKDKKRPRKYPWVNRYGYASEVVMKVQLPVGFSLKEAAQKTTQELPHGDVRVRIEEKDGAAEAAIRASAVPAVIPPAEWSGLRNQTESLLARVSQNLSVVDRVTELLSEKEPRQAEKLLADWIEKNPKDATLYHRLGKVYHRCGRMVNARRNYRKAVELNPKPLGPYLDTCTSLGGIAGDYGKGFRRDEAVEVMKGAVTGAEDTRAATLSLAELYERNDSGIQYGQDAPVEKAIEVYRGLLEKKKDDEKVLLALAECYFASKNYEEAEKSFAKVLETNGTSLGASAGRWTCLAFMGRPEQAANAVMGAYDQNQYRLASLSRLFQLLIHKRHYAEAAMMGDKIITLTPAARSLSELPPMLRRLAAAEKRDYAAWIDLSTPENAFISMMAALTFEDRERTKRCFATRPGLTDPEIALIAEMFRATVGALAPGLRDYILDQMANEWKCSKKDLPGGDVEVRFSPAVSMGTRTANAEVVAQVTREKEEWKVCAMGGRQPNPMLLGLMAASYVEEGDFEKAKHYVDRYIGLGMQETLLSTQERSIYQDLEEQPYPDEKSRIIALAGAMLIEAERVHLGLDYLKKALGKMADNRILARYVAEVSLRADDPQESIRLLKGMVTPTIRDKKILRTLADAYSESNEHKEAETFAGRLAEISASDPSAALLQVQLLERAGKYEEALQKFEQAKTMLPLTMRAGLEADLRAHLGQAEKVIELSKDRKIFEGPDRRLVRLGLWDAFVELGDMDRAGEQVECMLLENPGDLRSLLMLARQMVLFGDREEAADLLTRARSATMLDAEDLMRLGETEQALGNYKAAVAIYEPITYSSRISLLVYVRLFTGVCYLHLGDAEKAKAAFARAGEVQRSPLWPRQVIDHLQGTLSEEKLFAEAEKPASKDERNNHICEAGYYAGMKCLAEGKKEKGLALLKRAVATGSHDTSEFVLANAVLAKGGL